MTSVSSDLPEKQEPDPFATPESSDPALAAEELFVHGLLSVLHDPDAAKRRVDLAIEAIRAESAARRTPGRRLRRFAGVAVALLAILGAVIFLFPHERSANALVRASIAAARERGHQRYEIRRAFSPEYRLSDEPVGSIDNSGTGLFLLQTRGPLGNLAIMGKDELGEWAIRRGGGVERERPREAWPRWASVKGEPILVESVDLLLEALTTGYTLRVEGLRAADGSPGELCDYIVGERKAETSAGHAQHVELLIDRATMILERLEMTWPDPAESPKAAPREAEQRKHVPPAPAPTGQAPADTPPGDAAAHRPPGQRRKMPAISRMVLNRVQSPELSADWYSPEAHLAK